jgi:hypothetical protein
MSVGYIERKNYRTDRCLVLSNKQRLELWKRDARFPAWAFTLNSMDVDEEIANAAKKDGYEIIYIELNGPDIWNFDCPKRHAYSVHPERLISDAARSAPFLGPDGVPEPVNGYTTWQRLELNLRPGAERLLRTKRPFQTFKFPRLVASVVGAAAANQYSNLDECQHSTEAVGYEKENAIWECFEQCTECCRNCKLGLKLRLVCKKTRDVGLLGSVTNEISSTALYQTITQSTGKDRLKQLQDQVLSANLFCKFLKQDGFDKKKLRRLW